MWILIGTLAYVLFLLVCILAYALTYLSSVIQVDSFSQLLYTMQVSMGGAENTIMQILGGFFSDYLLWIVLATIVYGLFMRTMLQMRRNRKLGIPLEHSSSKGVLVKSSAAICGLVAACVICCQLQIGYNVLGIEEYLEERTKYSTLYEDEYVKPSMDLLTFPEKKRNLIYIYMESMESTYTDASLGGGFDSNLIPELSALAKENTDFSADTDPKLNGGRVTNNTSWTVAGIVAQTSGTPLGLANSEYTQNFDDSVSFMPSLVTLGDLLEDAGYKNVFMCGSDASYAGRANYFQQHGDYEIFDLYTAREEGKIPDNYYEWWGFEDEKLVTYAQEKLLDLASESQPFNFTMLTADTHFKDGYLCEDCPDLYDEQYENVIACSDHRIAEFIRWIQQQDFYENTTIVVAGDHLSMDGLIPEVVDQENCTRHTLYMVINGPEYTLNQTRNFTTLDAFPTTLEAMGVQIEGHRLGLGTSLYSDVPTLSESMGFDQLNQEIAYRSNYYEQEIINGDDKADEDD